MSYTVDLLPTQRKFWEIPHDNNIDVSLYQGGYGSGKTFCGSLLGITLALKYPKILGLVTAKTVPLLRDTTLAEYMKHIERMGLTNCKFIKSENRLVFPNKSEIIFRHAEDEEVLKSLSVGFVEIEEMSDIPEATFKMLLSRLRQSPEPNWEHFRYRLFGHTNPQMGRGWIYKYFVEMKNELPNFRRVIASSTENSHLDPAFLEMLKASYNEDYYNIMVMGNDDGIENNLLTRDFDYYSQVREDISIKRDLPIHVTCDFNFDPMCWYIAQHYDNNVYYITELVRNNTTTEAAAQALCDTLSGYKDCQIIINGDASGNFNTTKGTDYIFIRNALARNGFKNVKLELLRTNPRIEWRIKCWNNMILGPDKKHHIFISKQCKYLIYNIQTLEIISGSSKPKLPTAYQIAKDNNLKYLGHPIDAASYLVCFYYPVKDTTIQGFNRGTAKDIFSDKYDKRLM